MSNQNSRRRALSRPQSRVTPPPLLTGCIRDLTPYIPASVASPPFGPPYPSWSWTLTSCRKLQMIARAEWVRLSGAKPPDQSWQYTYPHDDCPKELRKAGLKLAAELLKH